MLGTDIKLDERWNLTQAASGDAPILSDSDCFLQDIRLESITQENELFYDLSYGWSLLDFIQREDDELTRLEIRERIKYKLEKRSEIDINSIETDIAFEMDILKIAVFFKFNNDEEEQSIQVELSRVNVEVIVK